MADTNPAPASDVGELERAIASIRKWANNDALSAQERLSLIAWHPAIAAFRREPSAPAPEGELETTAEQRAAYRERAENDAFRDPWFRAFHRDFVRLQSEVARLRDERAAGFAEGIEAAAKAAEAAPGRRHICSSCGLTDIEEAERRQYWRAADHIAKLIRGAKE